MQLRPRAADINAMMFKRALDLQMTLRLERRWHCHLLWHEGKLQRQP
jgi:hypothetical protein